MANGKKKAKQTMEKKEEIHQDWAKKKQHVDPTESMIVLSGQLQLIWDQVLGNGGLRWQPAKACTHQGNCGEVEGRHEMSRSKTREVAGNALWGCEQVIFI